MLKNARARAFSAEPAPCSSCRLAANLRGTLLTCRARFINPQEFLIFLMRGAALLEHDLYGPQQPSLAPAAVPFLGLKPQ